MRRQYSSISTTAYTWGAGCFGALGHHNYYDCLIPTPVTSLLPTLTSVHAGWGASLALSKNGDVYQWGLLTNDLGLIFLTGRMYERVPSILKTLQKLPLNWLSLNTASCTPSLVLSNIQKVRTSAAFHIALTNDNKVYGWGMNLRGQLGLGHNRSVRDPTVIHILSDMHVVDISCGFQHSIVLTNDGNIYGFGKLYSNKPVIIKSSCKYKMISCGFNHSAALTEEGNIVTWGDNTFGQLGRNYNKSNTTTNNNNIPLKIEYESSEKFISVSCGQNHTIALTENGDVCAWGLNKHGQINNYRSSSPSPLHPFNSMITKLKLGKHVKVSKIVGGFYHTACLVENGRWIIRGPRYQKRMAGPMLPQPSVAASYHNDAATDDIENYNDDNDNVYDDDDDDDDSNHTYNDILSPETDTSFCDLSFGWKHIIGLKQDTIK